MNYKVVVDAGHGGVRNAQIKKWMSDFVNKYKGLRTFGKNVLFNVIKNIRYVLWSGKTL